MLENEAGNKETNMHVYGNLNWHLSWLLQAPRTLKITPKPSWKHSPRNPPNSYIRTLKISKSKKKLKIKLACWNPTFLRSTKLKSRREGDLTCSYPNKGEIVRWQGCRCANRVKTTMEMEAPSIGGANYEETTLVRWIFGKKGRMEERRRVSAEERRRVSADGTMEEEKETSREDVGYICIQEIRKCWIHLDLSDELIWQNGGL